MYAILVILENGVSIRELGLLDRWKGRITRGIRGNLIHRLRRANSGKVRSWMCARTEKEAFPFTTYLRS